MKTVRRPPYPKWNPGYFPCSSLTPLPLSSRRPSVSFGGFGLKRAWYGTHHHYTDEHSIAYVVESCYKDNARNSENVFEGFLQGAVA